MPVLSFWYRRAGLMVSICSLWTKQTSEAGRSGGVARGLRKSCPEARDVIYILVKMLSQCLSSLLAVLEVCAGIEMFAFNFHFGNVTNL